jgi:hypothetical protein
VASVTQPSDIAIDDQVIAASKDVQERLHAAGRKFDVDVLSEPEVPKAMYDKAQSAFRFACPHLSHPQPVFVGMWDPRFFACQVCYGQDALPSRRGKQTCDLCGNRSELLHLAVSTWNFVVMLAGVCPDCALRVEQ